MSSRYTSVDIHTLKIHEMYYSHIIESSAPTDLFKLSPTEGWAPELWLLLWLMGVEWQVVLVLKRRLQTHQSADAWTSLAEEFMTSDTVASHR